MPVRRRYASVRNAAIYTGLSERTIRRAIADARITSLRLDDSSRVIIDLNDLDRLLAQSGAQN